MVNIQSIEGLVGEYEQPKCKWKGNVSGESIT